MLRDVFVFAYERSSQLYSTIRKNFGDPDPFRVRYRESIAKIIQNIVQNVKNKNEAVAIIKSHASESIPIKDQARFIEVVEIEIMNLHEGNIARFRLSLSEYHTWKKNWY
ncbi:MAG: hypothetical protein HZB76_05395 [Chlamydiae bacterium]|nr:hypothetical protein [Chlamydiota bacterium]